MSRRTKKIALNRRIKLMCDRTWQKLFKEHGIAPRIRKKHREYKAIAVAAEVRVRCMRKSLCPHPAAKKTVFATKQARKQMGDLAGKIVSEQQLSKYLNKPRMMCFDVVVQK